jgi:hypothetical protein
MKKSKILSKEINNNDDLLIKKEAKKSKNTDNTNLRIDKLDKELIELYNGEELIEYDFVGNIIPNEKYTSEVLVKEEIIPGEKYKAEIFINKKNI